MIFGGLIEGQQFIDRGGKIMISLLDINTKATYACGNMQLTFSGMIPNVVHLIIQMIWIIVPILLVVFGLLDLAKAVMAQKEDEIKKGQQTLVKRAVAAIIVFLVIPIVQIIINFVSGEDDTVMSCFNCFINGSVGDGGCRLQSGINQGL